MWLSDKREPIDEAVALLNEYLPQHKPIPHIHHDAMWQPNEQQCMKSGYVRLDGPVIYSPSLPVAAHGTIFIPAGIGVFLPPVLREDGEEYRTYIDILGDFVNIATPVYTRLDEHRGLRYGIAYDRHTFVVGRSK